MTFCPDPLPCPNPACQSAETYVGHRTHYVMCRKCHMTGPNGQNDEEAVHNWNRLPRIGVDLPAEIPRNPLCDLCGSELIPGLIHYCETIFVGNL